MNILPVEAVVYLIDLIRNRDTADIFIGNDIVDDGDVTCNANE